MPFDPVRQCREATRLRANGKFTEALALLDQAIRLDSQMAEAYAQRCACYCDLHEYALAIEDATRAIALDPEMVCPLRYRARAAHCLGEGESAIADLNKALQLAPENPTIYYERSGMFFDAGDYAATIADLDQFLQQCPREASGYWSRACCRYYLGELDLALVDIDEAIRLKREDASFLCFRAQILCEMGRVDEASAQLEAVAAQDPRLTPGRLGGMIATKRGNYLEAIQHFDAVLEAEPTNARVYYDRGMAWYELHEYEKALRDVDEAVRLEPDNGVGLYQRAKLLYLLDRIDDATAAHEAAVAHKRGAEGEDWDAERSWLGGVIALCRGDYWEAIPQFGAALEFDSTSARTYLSRGKAWYRMREYERALSDFDRAVTLAPERHFQYIDRANALMGLQRYADANRALVEARRRSPDSADSYWNLAWFRATCPDPEFRNGRQAVAMGHKAIELAGEHPTWQLFVALAAAYAECGDFDEAIRWQTKVLANAPEEDRPGWEAILEAYRAGIPRRLAKGEDWDW